MDSRPQSPSCSPNTACAHSEAAQEMCVCAQAEFELQDRSEAVLLSWPQGDGQTREWKVHALVRIQNVHDLLYRQHRTCAHMDSPSTDHDIAMGPCDRRNVCESETNAVTNSRVCLQSLFSDRYQSVSVFCVHVCACQRTCAPLDMSVRALPRAMHAHARACVCVCVCVCARASAHMRGCINAPVRHSCHQ